MTSSSRWPPIATPPISAPQPPAMGFTSIRLLRIVALVSSWRRNGRTVAAVASIAAGRGRCGCEKAALRYPAAGLWLDPATRKSVRPGDRRGAMLQRGWDAVKDIGGILWPARFSIGVVIISVPFLWLL